MKNNDLIALTEDYVKKAMSGKKVGLLLAHDFNHVDRVRNWAIWLACEEGFKNLDIVEVTALLHDIGLAEVRNENNRGKHGAIGAETASCFLHENSSLSNSQIEEITAAIRYHSVRPADAARLLSTLGKRGELIEIIRDADVLDALGAVGLMRAFASKSHLKEYNAGNVKGETWGLTAGEFSRKISKRGAAFPECIIDQVNWQISYPQNLHTKTAKRIAEPLAEFMKVFVRELDYEVRHGT